MNPSNKSSQQTNEIGKSPSKADTSKSDKTSNNNDETPKKPLSQFECIQLSLKNQKLNDEVKSLKAQILNLNDKINEQTVTITNNKLIYDKETKSMKDQYTKEIKGLKQKIENSNSELKTIENKYKIKTNEIENQKQLLAIHIKNLESQINEYKSKISQISHEYESQILIINDSKKRAISDLSLIHI